MKLHLNLTLRRALLAAMAMVALHTAEADMTPTNGHMYVTGVVSLATTEAWTEAWGSTTGVLSVGTSVGAGTLTLTSDDYITPNSIFLGGKGYESNGSTASNGTLEIEEGATLTVNGSTNVGNSQIGGKGTLTLDGGTLNAGNALYVGVNAGSGTVTAKDGSTITVASGSTGAVFAMSHRTISAPEDTVTLTGSSITVGAKGGVRDYTSIGHSAGTATLNLEDGSTATFHDQTIVGEMGGSNGTIYVKGGSTLNLGTVTVLGAAAGANGKIYIEGDYSTLTADELVIGDKGTGTVEVTATANDGWEDTYTISAKEITLGESAGGRGTLSIGEAATVGKITNLRVGREGIGTLTTEADIETDTLAIAQSGSSVTVKNYSTVDTGYLAILGGTLNIATVDENGDDTVYSDGSVNVSGATYTDAGSTINIAVGGELTTQGGSSEINGETIEETVIGGKVNIDGSISNNGDFSYGSWNANGSTTMLGTLTNNGVLNVGITDDDGEVLQTGSMAALQGITGTTGTTKVAKGSELQLTGASSQNKIVNDGSITLLSNATLTTGSLTGDGTTTIKIDSTTNSTASGSSIISGLTGEVGHVQVSIDLSNASAMVNKNFTFLNIAGNLAAYDDTEQCDIHLSDGASFSWDDGFINLNGNESKLWFTSDYENDSVNQIKFTKLAEKPADVTEADTKKEVVLYEDPDTGTEVTTTVTLEYEKQTLAATEKELLGFGDESTDLEAAIGTGTNQTLQTVVIESSQSNTTGGTGEENIVDMVIGSGLTTSSGLTVQTVVVTQITEIGEGPNATTEEKTAGTTGMVLILDGENTITGKNQKENNHLGFSDAVNGQTLTTADQVEKKAQTIDLIQVNEGTSVTLSNLNMHSTHNLTVAAGATITFDGVNVKVGGSTDHDILTEEVSVEVEDANSNTTTEKVTVANKNAAHLETGSIIGDTETDPSKAKETKVIIKGESVVAFEKVYTDNPNYDEGETNISGAKTEVVIDGATLGMDSVVVEEVEDDEGNKKEKEKHGQKIVFSNGSHLKGNGNLKNIHMSKDSVLTIGSSPGVFNASELTVEGMTRFYIIPNGNGWNYNGATTDATKDTGAISQLNVDKAVTLNGAQISFIYENPNPAGGFTELNGEELAAAKKDMGSEFTEGASIQFITGNLDQLTANGCTVNVDSLPTLDPESGLFWDVSEFFTKGIVTVMAEILEEPTRVANSLVSAGETVLNFGRLAEAQASLREAGTTRTWGSAIAMFDSIDSGSTTNGYDYSNWGAAVGIDHAFTKNTVVGVAFGCTWGENEAKEDNGYYSAGSIDQDAKMIGIYGVHKFQTKGLLNDVKLSAFAAYGMFENDSTRNGLKSGNTAKAEWDSDAWVLSASLSRDITTDSGVVFTPYVGVEYTTAGMDDFSEQGKSYAADYSADEDYSNLSVKVGVGVSKTYGSITPYANVAFISDVDRTAGEVTATGKRTITGKSALPGRNGFEIGVGATWQLTENLDVNAGYSAEIRDKATEHNARLGVGYTF